jgi:hypothetical protein
MTINPAVQTKLYEKLQANITLESLPTDVLRILDQALRDDYIMTAASIDKGNEGFWDEAYINFEGDTETLEIRASGAIFRFTIKVELLGIDPQRSTTPSEFHSFG